jgi:flagellar motility protein MotE (MotC chaperone)
VNIGILLIFLLTAKILVNLFFVDFNPIRVSMTPPAIAEEQVKPDTQPGPKQSSEGNVLPSALRKKERELRAWERRLKSREAELLPLQKEVETKLEELNALQTELTNFAKKLAEREQALEDSKNAHLVSLYTAMEPAKAAVIMGQLKTPIVVQILRHMKGKTAGKIIEMMAPEQGALISEKLSHMD